MPETQSIPESLLAELRTAPAIAVLTGAGVSAESGVPTFRDALTGHWSRFNPEDLATPEAFERHPALVTRWYDDRRLKVASCRPNAGHLALAELQRQVESTGRKFTLITQNVDRLHHSAGSTKVIELHGTLWVWRCLDCANESEERGPAFSDFPRHCSCGGICRPGVVWFGEELPKPALLAAEKAAGNCSLFLAVGTSSVVYPAAGMIDLALRNNAKFLEINPAPTAYTRKADWVLQAASGEALPELLTALR